VNGGWRHAWKRYGLGFRSAPGCFCRDAGAKVNDLLLESAGRPLQTVVKRQARVSQAEQGLLQLSCLIVRTNDARGLRDTQEDVVKRVDMTGHGQQLADGS
jgi:hypothetical protein